MKRKVWATHLVAREQVKSAGPWLLTGHLSSVCCLKKFIFWDKDLFKTFLHLGEFSSNAAFSQACCFVKLPVIFGVTYMDKSIQDFCSEQLVFLLKC